ncbi:MAG: DUF1284 domain-containing protein [Elusimicrobiales bacterium]|nr:DUF1284 domain-containing protein [Elusimicrobiales bacterium]
MTIKIRGHHFLCIEGFEGKGYSQAFIENMKNIIEMLRKNPLVIPVLCIDDICKCCPKLGNNKCINEKGGDEYVIEMDRNFYQKTKLDVNSVYSYKDIKRIIYDVFKTKSDLEGICDKCSWNNICRWYRLRDD